MKPFKILAIRALSDIVRRSELSAMTSLDTALYKV